MLEPRQLPLEQEKSLPPRDVERVDALGTPVPGPSRWRHGAVGRWPTRISAAILAIFVLASVLAPLIAPYGYATVGFIPLAAPSAAHPFGTDDLGRDVLSRVIYGGRTTLEVTVIAVAIALVIGVTLGLVSAYFGKWLDILVMRIVDVVFAFPAILLAIGLVAVLGASVQNLVIVITALTIPRFVVVVRAAARKVRYSEYLEAAQFMNTGALRIILRHVVPNVASYIMVEAALSMSSAVLI
jgi:peptide/nickel transport system permease protein